MTSDSESLENNPNLKSIFEESCKAEKEKTSEKKFRKPYNRDGSLKVKEVSDADFKEAIKFQKQVLGLFDAEGMSPPVGLREYVDYIDNENPNEKGRDD